MWLTFRNRLVGGVLLASSAGLIFGVLKHIEYPLLWNDEAETAMFAKRILRFGYPKVDDGRNVVSLFELPDKTIGVDQKSGAYLHTVWGHFYFAVLGQALTAMTGDLYGKTACLRVPFALAGLLGIALFVFASARLFYGDRAKALLFAACFVLLEALSIPLLLHMRQVRYYPLALLLTACFYYVYVVRVRSGPDSPGYKTCLAAVLFLIFNTFPFFFPAVAAVIVLMEGSRWFHRGSARSFLGGLLPVGAALAAVWPLFTYYNFPAMAAGFGKMFPLTPSARFERAADMAAFLRRFDFLWALLACRAAAMFLQLVRINRPQPVRIADRCHVANALSLLCLLHFLVLMKLPCVYVYERYYIFLQPAWLTVFLLDLFYLGEEGPWRSRSVLGKFAAVFFFSAVLWLGAVNASDKISLIRDYAYELSHQYKGPLDYAIPFIRARYPDTRKLTIATNYEECSYMYYLDSRVIVGYVGNNLKKDLSAVPDIISFRKKWAYTNGVFGFLLRKADYKKVTFSVADTVCNNIPQVSGIIPHIFRSPTVVKEGQAFELYLKRAPKPEQKLKPGSATKRARKPKI